MAPEDETRHDQRGAIVAAAARLLREGGPSRMTTRGVAERAGVQAPTIYRHFGDKDDLLEAVLETVMAEHVSAKAEDLAAAVAADTDPLDDLRRSWLAQVEFSLANPEVFRLLSDPDRVHGSPAARSGQEILVSKVRRVAATGRLRVPEAEAVTLVQAAGVGVISTLLAAAPAERDPALAETMLECVLDRILLDRRPAASGDDEVRSAAIALGAVAPGLDGLSEPERALLAEWLGRVVAAGR